METTLQRRLWNAVIAAVAEVCFPHNPNDCWTFLPAIAAIVAIIWKLAWSEISREMVVSKLLVEKCKQESRLEKGVSPHVPKTWSFISPAAWNVRCWMKNTTPGGDRSRVNRKTYLRRHMFRCKFCLSEMGNLFLSQVQNVAKELIFSQNHKPRDGQNVCAVAKGGSVLKSRSNWAETFSGADYSKSFFVK